MLDLLDGVADANALADGGQIGQRPAQPALIT